MRHSETRILTMEHVSCEVLANVHGKNGDSRRRRSCDSDIDDLCEGRMIDRSDAARRAWLTRRNGQPVTVRVRLVKRSDAPLSLLEFAQAIEDAPKVADLPFALTPPPNRNQVGEQRDLF